MTSRTKSGTVSQRVKPKRRPKTEVKLRTAYSRALDRVSWLRGEILDRKDSANTDELQAMHDAWDEARDNLYIAREDLEEAGYEVRKKSKSKSTKKSAAKTKVRTSARGTRY